VSDSGGDSLRPWLEMELTRQFSPVSAPESLWNSIQSPARRRAGAGVGARPWVLWPVTALILLLASGGARPGNMAQLTPRELRALATPSTPCDFWSDDPVEIRNWVKSKGNIDVDLPAERSGAVRLIGVRLVRVRGTLVAAIAYRTGNGADDGTGTLLVANRRSEENYPPATHAFSRTGSSVYPGLFSWSMRGQDYEIAAAGDSRAACLLCHLD
jgi:hypothetical protein